MKREIICKEFWVTIHGVLLLLWPSRCSILCTKEVIFHRPSMSFFKIPSQYRCTGYFGTWATVFLVFGLKKGYATDCCTLLQNKPKESYETRKGRSFVFPLCKCNLLFGTIIRKFEQTSIPTAHSHPNKNYSLLNL